MMLGFREDTALFGNPDSRPKYKKPIGFLLNAMPYFAVFAIIFMLVQLICLFGTLGFAADGLYRGSWFGAEPVSVSMDAEIWSPFDSLYFEVDEYAVRMVDDAYIQHVMED